MKNRVRDNYTFANINFLGKCNVDCFFCLGKDIEGLLSKHNQMLTHFSEFNNLHQFISLMQRHGVTRVYLTGQNTDPLMYKYKTEFTDYLQNMGFSVGIRTNGYLSLGDADFLNMLKDEIGYSIHTLNPMTNKMIMGMSDIPDWEKILQLNNNIRVSIVINRCNEWEIFDILRFISKFHNVRYIQLRKVSTETRTAKLQADMNSFEKIYTYCSKVFKLNKKFVSDAEEYIIYGKPVVFWRTVNTSVNSLNYFTDGTISSEYFIVEGYLNNYQKKGL